MPVKEEKQKKKPEPDINEPEGDWEDEEEQDYESMKPQELYKLCKKRNIECKPKKAKEYYIDLLEEADEDSDGDDWEDEGDEWEE